MKFSFKIGIIFILLAVLWEPVGAQQERAIVFNDDDGVHLRWPIHPEAEGYHVYRRSGDEPWQRLNTDLISVITDNSTIRSLLGTKSDILLGIIGVSSKTSDLTISDITNAATSADQFKMLQAFSLINPEFSEVLALSFLDDQASGNAQYKVTGLTSRTEEDWVITKIIDVDLKDAFPTVDEINGEGLHRSAIITWDKDKDALKEGSVVTYHVYRSDTELGPFSRVNYYGILPGSISLSDGSGVRSDPGIQQHLDEGIDNGRPYFYYVKAMNAFGMEGAPSITVEVVPGNSKPPGPPNNIEVKQSGKAASISWSHDDQRLKGFEISRSLSSDGEYHRVFPSGENAHIFIHQFLDFDLSPGMIYYYKLRSVNSKDIKGPWSHPVEYINWDKVPPAAPIGLEAVTDEDGRITVSWEASTEDDVIGYHIDRATDNNYDWQFRLNMKMLHETQYIDQRPTQSQSTYGYVVYAVDRSLNQSPASEMVKARLPDIVPPQAPIISSLNESGKDVNLEWSRSIEDDFDRYYVYRSDDDLSSRERIGESATNNYVDALDSDDGKLSYQISALDRDGNESELSQSISLTRKPSPYPDSPVNGSIQLTEGKVVFSWEAPGDDKVSGYLISRYTSSSTDRRDIQQLKADDVLEFTDKYVVTGKTYLYEIRTHDEAWQLSKPLSLSIKVE